MINRIIRAYKKVLGIPHTIYLDYVAATPLDPEVERSMQLYWRNQFGNPSSIHKQGVVSATAIKNARGSIARLINAHDDEIIFTGSGTEANNLAILGIVTRVMETGVRKPSDIHCITSAIEHPSVLNCFTYLESIGVRVTYLSVDSDGAFDLTTFDKELCEETVLVSLMMVNNEIGTIEPLAEIAKHIRNLKKKYNRNGKESYPLFHTDASQAALLLPINVLKLHTDLLTIDAQKMYGPKGIGALYKERNVTLSPLSFGGDQEQGFRAGTENTPLIVGFGAAFEKAVRVQEKETIRLTNLEKYFVSELKRNVPQASINSTAYVKVPSIINISITGVDNEYMVLLLDAHGIFVGTRTACDQSENSESPVLLATGKSDEEIASSLRFSLGRYTTKREIKRTIKKLGQLLTNFDTTHKS